jgi:hypothetical protein
MGANQPAPKDGCSSLRDLIGVRVFGRRDSNLDFISSEHKKHTGLDGAYIAIMVVTEKCRRIKPKTT